MADKITAPTLIIHAKNDKSIPYEMSIEFYEKLSVEKRLVLLDEGGHVFDTWKSRTTVIDETVKWFKKQLKL